MLFNYAASLWHLTVKNVAGSLLWQELCSLSAVGGVSQTSTCFSISPFSITQHFLPSLSCSLCKCQPLTDPLNTTQRKKHYDDPTSSKSSDSLSRLHQLLRPCDSSIPTLTSLILSTRLVERNVNKQGIGKCACVCCHVWQRFYFGRVGLCVPSASFSPSSCSLAGNQLLFYWRTILP